MRNCAATPQHVVGPSQLSHDLKYKVIDASATTTSFNAQTSATQSHKRKNSILIQQTATSLKLKGSSG